jgi:hypothetical protein
MRVSYLLLPLTFALLAMTSGCHHHRHFCCGGCAPCCAPCGACCGYAPPAVEGPIPPVAVPAGPVSSTHAPLVGIR